MGRFDEPSKASRRRRRDRLAERAARRWRQGSFETLHDAIEEVCGEEAAEGRPVAGRPRDGRVRLHLRGLAESALGREGYLRHVASVLGQAVAAMEILERPPISARSTLAGRAVRGQIEGVLVLHLRAETDAPIGAIAEALVRSGFDEPSFDSFEARRGSVGCGRLHRLATMREEVAISVVRCPLRQVTPGRFDLVRGRPVAIASLDDLRRCIERLAEGVDPF